ncbi:hypothetical protein [Actinomadura rubrisoli]|uniref:Uncharacterized protein n=1 Tax=Actinomadura rubrisoli TaxID=2530368 RepID=A0A4R4ZT30_9ACTN|nr:hypothetical protein [Actinomadura rubrisoli]TDD61436.1 hypothetical protein E1298_45365 [Actinomadura rubrisoli]
MSPSAVPTRDDLVARLRVRFADIPAENVRRCVDDLWCCCTHLGVRPDEQAIERLAASRLTGVVRGAPPPCPDHPDGRRPSRPPGIRVTESRAPGAFAPPAAPHPHLRDALAAPDPGDPTAPSRKARAAARTPIGM